MSCAPWFGPISEAAPPRAPPKAQLHLQVSSGPGGAREGEWLDLELVIRNVGACAFTIPLDEAVYLTCALHDPGVLVGHAVRAVSGPAPAHGLVEIAPAGTAVRRWSIYLRTSGVAEIRAELSNTRTRILSGGRLVDVPSMWTGSVRADETIQIERADAQASASFSDTKEGEAWAGQGAPHQLGRFDSIAQRCWGPRAAESGLSVLWGEAMRPSDPAERSLLFLGVCLAAERGWARSYALPLLRTPLEELSVSDRRCFASLASRVAKGHSDGSELGAHSVRIHYHFRYDEAAVELARTVLVRLLDDADPAVKALARGSQRR